MRRPFCFIFAAYAFGIAIVYFLKPYPPLMLITSLLLITATAYVIAIKVASQKIVCALMVLFMVTGAAYSYYDLHRKSSVEKYAVDTGQADIAADHITLNGITTKVHSPESDYHKLVISTDAYDNVLVCISGEIPSPEDMIGRELSVSGTVELPSPAKNPGCFDYALYLKTQDIRIVLNCNAQQLTVGTVKGPAGSFSSAVAKIKYSFLDDLKKNVSPDVFGIMTGMLFGDKTFMDEDIYEMFQINGIAHILSVSGIHVGIVYGFFCIIFGSRRKPFPALAIISLLFTYAAFAEFSPSVMRAVIMITVHIAGCVFYKRYDLLTGTCFSAFIMLLAEPLELFHIGFQLSFCAVFLLAFMLPYCRRLLGNICGSVLPLLIIQVGMAPITAYQFNYISPVAFLINIPVIFISGLIIPAGIMMIPLSFIAVELFTVAADMLGHIVDIMLFLGESANVLPLGHFRVVSPPATLLFLFYGFLFLFSSESFRILYQRKKYSVIRRILAVVILFSIVFGSGPVLVQDRSELIFVDVGQGDCLHIRTPGGKNILIDGGGSADYNVGKKVLLPYLLKNGVGHIDLALVTHLHTDHYKGIQELANEMDIKQLGLYHGNRLKESEIKADTGINELLYLYKGQVIELDKNISIEIVYPEKKSDEEYENIIIEDEDENKNSLVFKISYEDVSALMTGDIDADGELEMIRLNEGSGLKSDILKVAHHGSRYSTSDVFLETVSPAVAVFQVGGNNFGHPTSEIIEKCRKADIKIYRNDRDGAIMYKDGKFSSALCDK